MVGVGGGVVVGRCVQCRGEWDEYDVRYICRGCQVLMLVCGVCRPALPMDRLKQQAVTLLCRKCDEEGGCSLVKPTGD